LTGHWALVLHEHVRGNSLSHFFELVPHSKNSILGPREIALTPTPLLLVHKSNLSLFRYTHYPEHGPTIRPESFSCVGSGGGSPKTEQRVVSRSRTGVSGRIPFGILQPSAQWHMTSTYLFTVRQHCQCLGSLRLESAVVDNVQHVFLHGVR